MRTALVTIAIGPTYVALATITHPSLRAYAERIGADFVVIDAQKISATSPHYEKFQLYDLLLRYDRIIYVDTDAIIRPDCPNLLDIVEASRLGIFNEGKYMERATAMAETAAAYGEKLKNWAGDYYNTGVMVLSRVHKPLFKKPEKEIWSFYEQSYINLRVLNDGYKVQELGHEFNRMSVADKVTGEHRLKSYIVHYAGVLGGLDKLIPSDLARWAANEHASMRRRITIGVGENRLGDNVCAEPVVRYIVESSPDTDFVIAAQYPRVFKHFEGRAVVCNFDDMPEIPDVPCKYINTAVAEDEVLSKYLRPDFMNMTDFISLVCLKKCLPDSMKQPRLEVTARGIANALDVAGTPLDELVLVHPGKAWESKTFPVCFWNTVVSGLVAKGRKVGIIGAQTKNGCGTVDVDVPDGCFDFRNLLDVDGLIAVISMSPVLVTNDSGPLHVAGAFDNKIVLIPSCKHPDLVLPWRKGNKYHKAVALYRKLTCDAFPFDPANPTKRSLKDVVGKIEDYLPSPEDVVAAATS